MEGTMKRLLLVSFILLTASVFAQPPVIDFETVGNSWTWNIFSQGTNGSFAIVANPDPSGLNTSDSCAMLMVDADGDPWAGVWCGDFPDMTIDSSNCVVKLLVYKDVVSNFDLKLEPPNVDHNVMNTVTNQWEELTFDYSSDIGATSATLTIIPDFPDTRTYASVNYFDYIRFLPYSELPVELTSFTVANNGAGQVVLNWQTATELNNRIFEIERKTGNENFATIGFVRGVGTTSEQHDYTFVDKNVNGQIYTYRLKQIDFNGSTTYSKEVTITAIGPKTFDLSQNYPNPFNPTTTIDFIVPQAGFVTLAVYNTLGEQVALLANGIMSEGSHTATFDAKSLPSGAYVYKLQAGNSVLTKKMLLMK
jgi:hypothetical protein